MHPGLRGAKALLLAIVGGFALSFTLETFQQFLPTRIPANIDLGANLLGDTLGAAAIDRAREGK